MMYVCSETYYEAYEIRKCYCEVIFTGLILYYD